MAEKTFNQTFEGYWREEKKSGLPKKSGVYTVYRCTFNKQEKTVSLHELIYIGESSNVNERVANHEKFPDWKKHLDQGNQLCFGFTGVASSDRERVEAAFINYHKPPENTEYVDLFPFEKTIVKTDGKNKLLGDSFVANTKKA